MRCLVTGVGGFIGGYLVEFLVEKKQEVVGLGRARPQALRGIDPRFFTFAQGDLLDRQALGNLIDSVRPEIVFHLAAQSYPGISWEQPAKTFEVNVLGTISLFEELRARGLDATIVIVGSSSEYGTNRDGRPIAEEDALAPSSPYAVSKLAQDHLGRLYHEAHGLKIVRCRPFFLIGPRKRGDVASDLARGVVAIERGRHDDLPVGKLDVVRDLLDVRDGVEALWLLAQHGRLGDVYNICSGQGYNLQDVLSIYKKLAKVEVRTRVDPNLVRPIDEKVKIGDMAKLRSLGWSAKRPIGQVLEDILDYWRQQEGPEPRERQGQKLVAC
jgi:GDP-4-dehydro-6-deoxy-D-mannose reductase